MLSSSTFGLAPSTYAQLTGLLASHPGVERAWAFGSRARGNHREASDLDLLVDAPGWQAAQRSALLNDLEQLRLMYRVDMVFEQQDLSPEFRAAINADRREFWAPRRHPAAVEALGGVSLKKFQTDVLTDLGHCVNELVRLKAQAQAAVQALQAMEGMEELAREAADFPKKAWKALKDTGRLPKAFAERPYSSRFDGSGEPVPNVCLKVPTGGGKTLLAAASVALVFSRYLGRHTGLVLWVVPNEAIYKQTLAALSHRDHPYRQILNVAAAGRVRVLEKNSPLTRMDVESHLCVMVLMLQSASRQSKETLKFFRDRGSVHGFLPGEDDVQAHWQLLQQVPNLDVYQGWGTHAEGARAQMGSIVKSSLGNVMRLMRPLVVIDEGHHAYSETALATIDGFNPCFMLELSATPRVPGPKGSGSNILVDVRGTDLDEAEMIKLPIQVEVKRWADWQSCLAASVQRLDELQREADLLRADTARYIRPILLVQVERTGADTRDAGFIHAEDAKAHLLQLGFAPEQIAIKTSEKNDLKAPENIDLLSPQCPVRAIITKQALQEGWDCPFAYVLCALAAGRNPAAMTQLVGRILRQPQVAKTGREALDACWVMCWEARTGDVVRSIKKSLEDEGMGDLGVTVRGDEADAVASRRVVTQRRPELAGLRLFLPKVCWVQPGEARRELVYESDVLGHVDWSALDADVLARNWASGEPGVAGERLSINLNILRGPQVVAERQALEGLAVLDRARLVRSLIDLAPNPWWVWQWVDTVVARLLAQGVSETALAASSASLSEALRVGIEAERDRLAHSVFEDLLTRGRIEFRLRADTADWELPRELQLELAGEPALLLRPDDSRQIEKSLLQPCYRTSDMNEFEVTMAGYLDQRAALHWWHRNVAKTQYGLQGWRRHRVYPDFVFALTVANGNVQTVLLETKGMHLAGSADTDYKRKLLERLSQAFADERLQQVGQLDLRGGGTTQVVCDLVFEQDWRGQLDARYFSNIGPAG